MAVRAFIVLLLAALAGCAGELPRREAAPASTAEPGVNKPAAPTFTYRPGS